LKNDTTKLHSTENKHKAGKFLTDRFRLLLCSYGTDEKCEEVLMKDADDDELTIWMAIYRLKSNERKLLSDYLKCVEQIILDI
jgi:hypothetical protein